MKPIYPCLWFNGQAQAAVEFYSTVFPSAQILQDSGMVVTCSLNGTKFMALNGGAMFRTNPAVSFFVYCGSDNEIDRIYAALLDGGSVIMPLGAYPWNRRYAWINDKFGVSWQLDVDDIRTSQKIVPTLLFSPPQSDAVAEAMHHYTRIFSDSKVLLEAPFAPDADRPIGTLLFAQFKLNGVVMNAMSSPMENDFNFSPGNSFVIECDTQEEIDHFWAELGAGGNYQMCGWLTDRYGVSWQVIPSILPQMMGDASRRDRVVDAFMKMQKFDIKTLEEA